MFVNHTIPGTNIDKAVAAWGIDMPAWIKLLAEACDRASQRDVAGRIGYSSGVVSKIINAKYPGDYGEAERLVRAAFSAERVMCPLFGSMALKTCLRNRRRAHSPRHEVHLAFDRACPSCPNNTDNPDREED